MPETIAAWLARHLGALGFVLSLSLGFEQGDAVPAILERGLWAMLGAGAIGLIVGNLMGGLLHVSRDDTTARQTDETLPASLPPLTD